MRAKIFRYAVMIFLGIMLVYLGFHNQETALEAVVTPIGFVLLAYGSIIGSADIVGTLFVGGWHW